MQSRRIELLFPVFLTAFCLFLYGFGIGALPLVDPNEPFYSLTAREMIDRGDPSTPVLFGEPQFEKPIFFYWVLYALGSVFGLTEGSMRLGPAFAGVLLALVTYAWGRLVFRDPRPALGAAMVLATSAKVVVLSRIVLPDVYLCLFTTSALAAFHWGYLTPARRSLAWTIFFAAMGMGTLTKGPLGVIVPLLAVAPFILLRREAALWKSMPWKRGFLVFAAIVVPWYALMTARHGDAFFGHFFFHENVRRFFVAEHRGMDRPFFYVLALAAGTFPWTALLVPAVKRAFGRRRELLVLLAAAAPFLFFTAAKSKLLSYILPVYPPLALLVAAWAWPAIRAARRGARLPAPFLAALGVTWLVAPAALLAGVGAYAAKNGLLLMPQLFLCAAAIVPPLGAAFYFAASRRPVAAFGSAATGAALLTAAAFGSLLPAAQAAFSSREAVARLEARAPSLRSSRILASKLYVRGVSFYAGTRRLGVVAEYPRRVFYTPPALPFVSTADDLDRLPDDEFPLYGVLRPKETRFLETIARDRYRVSVLEKNPAQVLLRLERLDAS